MPDFARRETELGLSIATEIGMPSQAEGKRVAAGIFDVEPELKSGDQRIGNEGEPLSRAIRKWPFACSCAGRIVLELDRKTRRLASYHAPRPLPAVAVNRVRLGVDVTRQAVFAAGPVQRRVSDTVGKRNQRKAGEASHRALGESPFRRRPQNRLTVALERRDGAADGRRDDDTCRAGGELDGLGHATARVLVASH